MEVSEKTENKKAISICRLFLQYLIGLSAAIIVLLVVVIVGAAYAISSEQFLYQANYADTVLNQEEEALTQDFDERLLPPYSRYVIMDADGNFVSGNMTERDREKTIRYFADGKKAYYDFYKVITQVNGNIIIVRYDMLVHFKNAAIHKIIPYPELTLMLIVVALIILFAIITAIKFSKKLKQNLVPIITATKKIEAQELDFQIEPTKIREFNASLAAIDQLKVALTASLQAQWQTEQQKKTQLSALAHDIKTPLTVIKGNAELLCEETLSAENKELIGYIQTGAATIEKYLALLMDVANHEALSFLPKEVEVAAFLKAILEAAVPLCKTKNIQLDCQNTVRIETMQIDEALLKRAIINVLDNAVRYSAGDSVIDLILLENETSFIFEIGDYGKGFSEESLKRATEEFFTDDGSRTDHHYGLGLNFARRVAEMHGGNLLINNREDKAGAKVSICIKK